MSCVASGSWGDGLHHRPHLQLFQDREVRGFPFQLICYFRFWPISHSVKISYMCTSLFFLSQKEKMIELSTREPFIQPLHILTATKHMISNTEIIEMPSIVFLEAVVVEWTLLKGEEECLACRPSIKLTPKVECVLTSLLWNLSSSNNASAPWLCFYLMAATPTLFLLGMCSINMWKYAVR